MEDCAYCTNPDVQARAIVRDELAWAFPTNMPIVPMHILVSPTRHVAAFNDLRADEVQAIFQLVERLRAVFKSAYGIDGFNYAWNEGEIAGQSVPHFHLHMLPRAAGDTGITEYEPRKFLYRPGSRPTTPEEELRDVASTLRRALE